MTAPRPGTTPATRERWAAAIRDRAERLWTPAHRSARLGGLHPFLDPVEAAPLLRALGLLDRHGDLPPESVRKFMQIGHMADALSPILERFAGACRPLRILDAGCGSSYLTLVLAWACRHRWHADARILGVDRDETVIRRCRRSTRLAGLDDTLRFETAPLDDLDPAAAWNRAFGESPARPFLHVLVALHACDTATDDALALGVREEARLIAAAPCCHAELSRICAARAEHPDAGPLAPVWLSPHLRREAAATLTDALRLLLLQSHGYQTTAMEFVPSRHTPKNTLLRAVRTDAPDPAAARRYAALRDALGGADIHLARRLPPIG